MVVVIVVVEVVVVVEVAVLLCAPTLCPNVVHVYCYFWASTASNCTTNMPRYTKTEHTRGYNLARVFIKKKKKRITYTGIPGINITYQDLHL